MLFRLLGMLLSGAFVGWIAGSLMGERNGLMGNIVVGIIGSVIGGVLFSLLGFYAYGWFADLVVSVVGACVLLWLSRRFFR